LRPWATRGKRRPMPQQPMVRKKQKARRTKQLAQWREKQEQQEKKAAPAKK
jgi:hypothetical protein